MQSQKTHEDLLILLILILIDDVRHFSLQPQNDLMTILGYRDASIPARD